MGGVENFFLHSQGVWRGGPMRGGCEEDLSDKRKGLFHRGHARTHAHGHRDSMTESAQWADSVKMEKVLELVG